MEVQIALIGAGMFGGEVHTRAYADLQRHGIAPYLGRIGLGDWAGDLGGVRFALVAIGTRTEKSARKAQRQYRERSGAKPAIYWGAEPWKKVLKDFPSVDVVAVATPDHLHTPVILSALNAGAHVLTEKPLCLDIQEADQIVELARRKNRMVALDMHKRYDPDHLRIRADLKRRIGEPLYGQAYLEEPLQVSAKTFKWVEQSDPFSYVGCHWVDLVYHYFSSKPVALTAVGQKKKLRSMGIDAYDAVQVRVDYENGLSMCYHNNWITPADFEGPVNQGHELVGTEGKVESDQQYRGLRWWRQGAGSRTVNTHFTREALRPDGSAGYVGYGTDSIHAALAAVCRVKFSGARPGELAQTCANAEEGRVTVAILHAARMVCDLNSRYLQMGKGAPVSARFGPDGITIVDPTRSGEGPESVFRRIYKKRI
jgi:predicted dehydrogenase